MKLYGPKGIMQYFDSKKEFEDGVIPFAPMTYLTKQNNAGDGIELLIGYTINGDAILIKEAPIHDIKKSESVNSYKIYKSGFENFYKKVKGPKISTDSIFREPKVGDTLMCISKRYQGCTFGELYTVKEIDKGRLAFESGAEYTYESKYFIVVDEKEKHKFMTNDEFKDIVIGHSSHDTVRTITGDSSIVIGNSYSWPAKWIINESLIDEDEIKQRTIKGTENIIRRPRLEDEDIVHRTYKVPEKIKRSK